MIDEHDLVISPMVLLELDYLCEVGRTKVPGSTIVADLTTRAGLRMSNTDFQQIVVAAHDLSWTRDPFDRLIAANAIVDGCRLLTADQRIRQHLPAAIW